jgi:hypothetical protein
MRKFPKVVRLDTSDLHVFPRAAEVGEWAVPGSFVFADASIGDLAGKERLAFAHGWLGVASFGFAALAEVAEIPEAEFFQVVERLARQFVERYGAPGLDAALPAARGEADYAAGLCDHKVHQLLALEREAGSAGIVERVRLVRPERVATHARIWEAWFGEIVAAGAAAAEHDAAENDAGAEDWGAKDREKDEPGERS